MLCPWCGAEVPSSKFCENCGNALAADFPQRERDAEQPGWVYMPFTPPAGQPDQGQTAGQPQAQPTTVGQPQVQPTGAYQPAAQAQPTTAGQPAAQPTGAYQPAAQVQQEGAYQNPYQVPSQNPYQGQSPYQADPYQPAQPWASQPYQANAQQPPYGGASGMPSEAEAPAQGRPWYGKTWVIVLFLLFFWPVGIVLVWMRSCTWPKAAKVVVSILLALLVMANVGAFVAPAAYELSEPDSLDGPDIEALLSESDSADGAGSAAAGSAAGADAASGAVGGSASAAASSSAKPKGDGRLYDANGVPTLFALTELTGQELIDALEEAGYSWLDGANMWFGEGGSLVEAYGADGAVAKDAVAAYGKLGSGTPTAFVVTAGGYASPAAALDAMTKDVVVQDRIDDDDATFAIVYGSPLDECLVSVTPSIDEDHTFLVFNAEAIESGLFTELIGIDAGKSIDEVWETVKNG